MKLIYALLADHAFLSIDKKVNIIGVFETINAVNFPVTHPRFVVVGSIQPSKRQFKLALDIVDSDDKSILGRLQEREVNLPESKLPQSFNFIVEIINTNFKAMGKYKVKIIVDQEKIAEMVIKLVEINPVKPS